MVPNRLLTRQLLTGLRITVVLTVLLGLAYPLAVTAVSQLAFRDRAEGSLVERGGAVVGSSLLGQAFAEPGYFHGRPSVSGYDPLASGGSNLGPSNQTLLDQVAERVAAVREENGLAAGTPVPVDAVTASASGLDPQISVAYARLQAPRVAEARGVAVDEVLRLVDDHTQTRPLGFLGENGVNVLHLNLALDERT